MENMVKKLIEQIEMDDYESKGGFLKNNIHYIALKEESSKQGNKLSIIRRQNAKITELEKALAISEKALELACEDIAQRGLCCWSECHDTGDCRLCWMTKFKAQAAKEM